MGTHKINPNQAKSTKQKKKKKKKKKKKAQNQAISLTQNHNPEITPISRLRSAQKNHINSPHFQNNTQITPNFNQIKSKSQHDRNRHNSSHQKNLIKNDQKQNHAT